MYYEGGISSIYLWDLDEGFAGVVSAEENNERIIKRVGTRYTCLKLMRDGRRGLVAGSGKSAHYKLTSTVILHLAHGSGREGG